MAEKHEAQTDAFSADGFVPVRVQALLLGGVTSYCGVWRKGKDKVEGDNLVRLDNDEGLHAGHVADGAELLLDVSLSAAAPAGPPWAAGIKTADATARKRPGDLRLERMATGVFAAAHRRNYVRSRGPPGLSRHQACREWLLAPSGHPHVPTSGR